MNGQGLWAHLWLNEHYSVHFVWFWLLILLFSHSDISKHVKIMQLCLKTYTHTRLTALFPELPGWAGTRKVKPIWILLKQETVSGSGISWPFLSPNQQRQSTEGINIYFCKISKWQDEFLHICVAMNFKHAHKEHTHTHTTIQRPLVRDYPGRLVPEETLTHSQSHPSWSSDILYQLPPFTTIHSILCVQFMSLTVLFDNLSPGPLWSSSCLGPSTSYSMHFFTQSLHKAMYRNSMVQLKCQQKLQCQDYWDSITQCWKYYDNTLWNTWQVISSELEYTRCIQNYTQSFMHINTQV